MPTTDMHQKAGTEEKENMKDTFGDAVNRTLYKTIGEMGDGTQPFFLSDAEADERLTNLRQGIKQLLGNPDKKEKPSL